MKSVGILVAMKDELAPLRKRYRLEWTGPGNFFTGIHRGMRLQVSLCGAGPYRASAAMANLVRYGRPDLILGVGLSGGLSPDVQLSDVVLACSVQTPGKPTLRPGLHLLRENGARWASGPLLTLATVLTTRAEKAEVAAVYPDCWAVDMETYSMAQAAHEANLPWLALRSISDAWNRDLPLDFNLYLDTQGQAQIWPLLKAAARNPRLLGELTRFGQAVFAARRPLLEEFDALLDEIAR